MLKSKVSVRGQTVIPQEIREKLGIEPNSEVAWWVRDGVVKMMPIPEDPITASIGMLKGKGPSSADVITERKRDLQMENRKYARYLKKGSPKSRAG